MYQVVELWHVISTIGRILSDETRRPNVHCIMLANNKESFQYSFWWKEFEIADKVEQLKGFGQSFTAVGHRGATIYFKTIDVSEERKEQIKTNRIPFFGFGTNKSAQFTGTSLYSTEDYQHIDDRELLDDSKLIYNKIIIWHKSKAIRLCLYYDENRQYFVYCHWYGTKKERLKDYILFTLDPKNKNEIYGFGEYSDAIPAFEAMKKLRRLKNENRWYYQDNSIGTLIDDYFKNVK